MKLLITGCAGFIGMHVAERLLAAGHEVAGIDSLNDYYDVRLKEARLERLRRLPGYDFHRLDLADRQASAGLFASVRPQTVIHLAAQPGVRHSLNHPAAYIDANVVAFANVLEGCRQQGVGHLIFASSSSVYGGNTALPYRETDNVDHPVSLYAATKKANELMAHTYAHLYGLPCTGLRFFTVYGPWGRPDMAYWSFAEKILAGEPIQVFNHGDMRRDFTYIDDIAEAVVRLIDHPACAEAGFDTARPDAATSWAPWRIFNIGNHQPVALLDFIAELERALGKPAIREMRPMQAGDVQATYADTTRLAQLTGFAPATTLATGIDRFVAWFLDWRARAATLTT